jgi:hypothetical protein
MGICLSLVTFSLIARALFAYRSWPTCLSLMAYLLIAYDLPAYYMVHFINFIYHLP